MSSQAERPLFIFDGDCAFCRAWVERWREITGDRVEYRPYQEVIDQFPDIGLIGFRSRSWLIETGGRRWSGAGAVLRLYELVGEHRVLARLYQRVLLFQDLSEWVYQRIAGHRSAAAHVTRWFWGTPPLRPRYDRMRSLFARGIGLTYLAAFWSLAVQIRGLIGREGILPASEFLQGIRGVYGPEAGWQFPTLFWLDCSDQMLAGTCWAGVLLAAMVVVGVCPGPCLAVLWVLYLSIVTVGQDFLRFQWDMLLLEAGFLALLFAPWSLWLDRPRYEPSRTLIWLIRLLLFKLMFLSGVVKLASGDRAWAAWEALKYHYETQPLPTWTSWYMHQLPQWFQKLSTGFMFWAELFAPWFLFMPRRLRKFAFWNIVVLQLLIAATGNYGFFNLLALVLCISLIEDRDLGRLGRSTQPSRRRGPVRKGVVAVCGVIVLILTLMMTVDATPIPMEFPAPLRTLQRWAGPLQLVNAYGLFAIMTTDRLEITVEGSDDGQTWRPYHFRWKPDEIDRRPRFCTPHMPRLDWQMWFAALAGDCRRVPWFLRFEERLLEGSQPVLALLRENPFPDRPPRLLRARLDLYRFTRTSGRTWWEPIPIGPFCPALRLRPAGPDSNRPRSLDLPEPD